MELVEFRQIARNVFLLSILAVIISYFIHLNNPLIYPGLEERLAWVCIFSGVITAILYFSDRFSSSRKQVLGYKSDRHRPKKSPGLKNKLASFKAMDRETLARLLFRYLFEILLLSFLILALVRDLSPNFASIINSNYLLGLVFLSGLITIAFPPKETNPKGTPLGKNDYVFAGILGVAGSVMVWYNIQSIGILSFIISPIAGLLIILMSILLMEED
jgi:hypothetical protein